MPTPGLVQLHAWQPLCWETGYLHPLYCRASSSCLSLSIQGPMLLLQELFLLGLQPGESDQKWAQEPRSCQAEPLFIPFSSYVDPQPSTWHRHLPFNTVCMKELLYPPFWSVGHWGSDGRIQTLKTVTPQAASPC